MDVAGGFTYNATAKYVCQIITIYNYEETGCIVTDVVEETGSSPNDREKKGCKNFQSCYIHIV